MPSSTFKRVEIHIIPGIFQRLITAAITSCNILATLIAPKNQLEPAQIIQVALHRGTVKQTYSKWSIDHRNVSQPRQCLPGLN